jgi:hypothetical protein
MKALLLRSLLIAVLVGPAIDLVRTVASFHSGTRYDPPLSEAEFHQMGNMTVNEMEATLAKRRIKMTRWDWLRDSVPYSYFWKQVARDAIVPSCGVFFACTWIGWMEKRRFQRLKTAGLTG